MLIVLMLEFDRVIATYPTVRVVRAQAERNVDAEPEVPVGDGLDRGVERRYDLVVGDIAG